MRKDPGKEKDIPNPGMSLISDCAKLAYYFKLNM